MNSASMSGASLGARETKKADMIVPIPRAAIPAALGFHAATQFALQRSHQHGGRNRQDLHHFERKGEAGKGGEEVSDQQGHDKG